MTAVDDPALRTGTEGAPPPFRYATPAPGDDPFSPAGRWVRAGTRERVDRLGGTFSADRLSVYFGVPGLTRDLHPVSPWVGVDAHRPLPAPPDGFSDPAEFRDRFAAAVEEAVGDAETVAVAASGGMDSLAVLDTTARLCRSTGRRLVAVTLDIADDAGRRTAATARRQLDFLRIDADLVAVPPLPSRWPEPAWTPEGPRFDAWPRCHAGIAQTAAGRGATVLLQGNGADQLLQVPPYLTPELVWSRDLRRLAAYRRDVDSGAAVNTALSAVGRLDRPALARVYWAAAWPGFTTDRGAAVLAPERAPAVRAWLAGFQDECLRATRSSWAGATVLHRLFPYDLLADAGPLPERMPFLDPGFARYAYHLPLAARFDPAQPNAYLRGKGLVAGVLPTGVDSVLAPRRQRCYKAYRRYWQGVDREAELAVELGLVRPDWRAHCRDAFDLAMVQSCERWIAGALEHGATALPGSQDVN